MDLVNLFLLFAIIYLGLLIFEKLSGVILVLLIGVLLYSLGAWVWGLLSRGLSYVGELSGSSVGFFGLIVPAPFLVVVLMCSVGIFFLVFNPWRYVQ